MTKGNTNTGPNTIVSFDSFVVELQGDLPKLWADNTKVTFTFLQEYYGEKMARVGRAVYILQGRGFLSLSTPKGSLILVVPPLPTAASHADIDKDQKLLDFLDAFTLLQRHILTAIYQECTRVPSPYRSNSIRTNFFQLARLVNCSYGGVVNSVERLVRSGALTKQVFFPIKTARAEGIWFTLTLTDKAIASLSDNSKEGTQ